MPDAVLGTLCQLHALYLHDILDEILLASPSMLLIRKLRHLPEIPQLGSDEERSVPLKPTFLIPYNVCYVRPSRSKHGKSLCSSMCHGGCSWSSLSNRVVHWRGGALLLSTIPSAPADLSQGDAGYGRNPAKREVPSTHTRPLFPSSWFHGLSNPHTSSS